jgi:hypothetical protein
MLTENHVKALIARLAIIYGDKVNVELKAADDEWDAPYITIDHGDYVMLEHFDVKGTYDLYFRQTYPGTMDDPPSEDYNPVKTDIQLISMNHVARVILRRAVDQHIDEVDMSEVPEAQDIPF